MRAQLAPNLKATLGETAPLRYRIRSKGLPPFVRSASALCRWGSYLVIVQDDVQSLALLDSNGQVDPFPLPSDQGVLLFDDAHGNKHAKLDLEAALCLPDGRFVAFGSGATPMRERLVVMRPGGEARIIDGATLYAMLRREGGFAGKGLNIEGAVFDRGAIRFFQRGNGSRAASQGVVNAIGDIALEAFLLWLDHHGAAPSLTRFQPIDLGEIRGIRFGFTDATSTIDGHIAFLACAEDSADAVSDGPVLGCRFGVMTDDGIHMTDIVDRAGKPITLKLEGIAGRAQDRSHFDVVADRDLPNEPALIGTLRISPAYFAQGGDR